MNFIAHDQDLSGFCCTTVDNQQKFLRIYGDFEHKQQIAQGAAYREFYL